MSPIAEIETELEKTPKERKPSEDLFAAFEEINESPKKANMEAKRSPSPKKRSVSPKKGQEPLVSSPKRSISPTKVPELTPMSTRSRTCSENQVFFIFHESNL